MFDFLSVAVNTYSGFGMPFSLNWIGNIIKWLIDGCQSIGLGIILFTLMLKLITLPFDIISRVSTKKNSLKMKRMRPQLEKLQRQYANDKALYNQKMQALYKKEGYSMFSTCLPMIVTIVIFIVVIYQFTAYSRYTNLTMINNMASAYTDAVVALSDEDGSYIVAEKDENGRIKTVTVSDELFTSDYCADLDGIHFDGERYLATDISTLFALVKAMNEKGYDYYIAEEKFAYNTETDTYTLKFEGEGSFDKDYYKRQIAKERADAASSSENPEGFMDGVTDDDIEKRINAVVSESLVDYKFAKYVDENVKAVGRAAAAEYYRENAPQFLWVRNLWVPDLPWKHPVFNQLKEYDFYGSLLEADKAKEAEYEEITAALKEEKDAPNGYLILVVLSIGIMFLSQFIMNRMQKDQMELQSVDGQAATTSKMMMWMMPIMFGVFAFIYTASFSLYMIVSSIVSTLSTLLIGFIVEKSFNKKLEKEELEKDKRISADTTGKGKIKK
ncbi:MAG: YidC/Oxa1 family membrane protein insertase [Clostridia bacterium]|nr:YidC/Oxa1 family membrane protein insertase [Clostridia bacterium]